MDGQTVEGPEIDQLVQRPALGDVEADQPAEVLALRRQRGTLVQFQDVARAKRLEV